MLSIKLLTPTPQESRRMATARFYSAIAPFNDFTRVVDPRVYQRVPQSWSLGVTDIVNSTGAIAAGNYKAVNFAGVAVVSGLMNALGHGNFPFVFGGDGTAFLAAPEDADRMQAVAAATAAWVRDDLGLQLRCAMVPVTAIHDAGHDLSVARFAPSTAVTYAMLGGGGLAWAETQMKRGAFGIEPGAKGVRPDLSGLSCRWQPITSRNGVILSLIARPAPGSQVEAFAEVMTNLLDAVMASGDALPVSPERLRVRWPPFGLHFEARSSRGRLPSGVRTAALLGRTLASWFILSRDKPFGRFDPRHYRRMNALNADFRKYDDGLKMTLDCTSELADRLEVMLAEARGRGLVHFGTFRQSQAQITCMVPSPMVDAHFHFVDGTDGGYAMAAKRLA